MRACLRAAVVLAAVGWLAFLTWAPATAQFAEPGSETEGTDNASAAGDDFHSYKLEHKSPHEIEQLLSDLLVEFRDEVQVIADPTANRVLLRGPEKAQAIARQLVESVDRPQGSSAKEKTTLKAYRLRPEALNEAASRLKLLYSGNSSVRIAADSGVSQLLIVAPASIHLEIARELSSQIAGTESAQRTDRDFKRAPIVPAETNERFIRLQTAQPARIESLLRDIFADRLHARVSTSPAFTDFQLVDPSGLSADLRVDRTQNGVGIRASEPLFGQLSRLIATLDTPPQAAGRKIRIMPIRRADPRKVRQAVEAYRRGTLPPGNSTTNPPGDASASRDVWSNGSGNRRTEREWVTPVSFQEEPGAPQAPTESPTTPEEMSPLDAESTRRRLRELGGGVEIETLDDLDVIILRGNDRDVEELSRIIREIERLSAEAEPEIEIVPLKHISSEAASEILAKVNLDLIGARQGRATATALVSPNSLLLVGWGEAMKALKELIAKLDQPADPDSQFRVFRLKYAPASVAATNLQTFFTGRTGLGTRVRVTPDPRTNSLLVHASPRDMLEIEKLIERIDTADSASVNQARIFQLKNTLAADLAATLNAAIDATRGGAGAAAGQKSSVLELLTIDADGQKLLKSGVLSDVRITPDPQRNALIVSAPAESMGLIEALIRQLDETPTGTAQIKVFRIVNGDATGLAQMLRALLPSQTGNIGPQLAISGGETSLAPLRFAVDLRTNSIIATGSASDLRVVEALLLRLDEKEVQTRKNAVYRLKNAPAIDVARAINDFLRSERTVQQAAPGNVSPFQQIESEVVVVPEPVSNSLILSATPRFFEDIRSLVERLDAQPPQVMIQVLIAEVALNDADEFGVELGLQDSLLFDRSLLGDLITTTNTSQVSTPSGILTSTNEVIQSATQAPGFNFNGTPLPDLGNSGSERSLATADKVAGQGVSNFAMGRLNSELGFGGLVLSASSDSVSVLLRALQETRRLEILSRPQVMTLDNQPAFIQVGQRVPRIVGSTINQLGQINTIELENVGLILAVTPRISPDGMVVMEIDAEKSELGSEADGIPVSVSADGTVVRSPRIDLTTAQTTVSATDGETIVLGGLITKGSSQIHRRVPWLGDLPLIGRLFRFDSLISRRTELLIIMTPHVVRNAEDAERIKKGETAKMHWTCADLHKLHGDGSLCNDPNCPVCDAQIPVIYPDANPRGQTSGGTGKEGSATDPKLEPAIPESGVPADLRPHGEATPPPAPPAAPDQGQASWQSGLNPTPTPLAKKMAEIQQKQQQSGQTPTVEEVGPYIPNFDEQGFPPAPLPDSESERAIDNGRVRQTSGKSTNSSKSKPIATFPPGWRK
ncbi:MAG: secretin N-terminal domain-containing protein [Planctomycetaceae bacterium]